MAIVLPRSTDIGLVMQCCNCISENTENPAYLPASNDRLFSTTSFPTGITGFLKRQRSAYPRILADVTGNL